MKYLFIVGNIMILLCLAACTTLVSSGETPAQEQLNTDNLILVDSTDDSKQKTDLESSVVKQEAAIGLAYTSEARITEEGMQDDYIYTLVDCEINPAQYEPLLLVNGAFTTKGEFAYYGFHKMIPLQVVIEAFGGSVTLDEITRTVFFQLEDKTMEVTVSDQKFPHYYTMNGEGKSKYWCLLYEDALYISLKFFEDELGLDVGYLPGEDIGLNIASTLTQ